MSALAGWFDLEFYLSVHQIEGLSMSGSWGCPHDVRGLCTKLKDIPCNPGMKGCILYGRFAFSDPEKNSPAIRRKLAEKNRKK
jgi:hypothetical protein